MAFDVTKFILRFTEEARELLMKLNEGLVRLEKNPEDEETIHDIFRAAHTIKGSSRMLKLKQITEVAHRVEDVLGALRDRKIAHSKLLADLIYRSVDIMGEMVEKAALNKEIDVDAGAICEKLDQAAKGNVPDDLVSDVKREEKTDNTTAVSDADSQEPGTGEKGDEPCKATSPGVLSQKEQKKKPLETVRINAGKLDEMIRLMGELISAHNRAAHRIEDVKAIDRISDDITKVLHEHETGTGSDIPGDVYSFTTAVNEIRHLAESLSSGLAALLTEMKNESIMQKLLISELQEKILVMRMVPLSMVFGSLHRIVRDISESHGKKVDLVIEGEDIELDKKMIEMIGDPLVHILRNSMDHGIELPEERLRAGKPERGVIRVSAFCDAGNVVIEVTDDGRGISLEKIREKAFRKKMYSEQELSELTESDLIGLIFLPGFSTSAIITDISGRGVGMDVVRRNIEEELRGSISVSTREGSGTTFLLRLPLTLAIMRILLLESGGMTFGITSNYAVEIVRVSLTDLITVVDRHAIRLREELIPVARLSALVAPEYRSAPGKDDFLVLIVQSGDEKLGLIIDSIINELDMVIKSFPNHMQNIDLVSGLTITGKNEIVSILHVPALFRKARERRVEERPGKPGREIIRLLVVDDSMNTREIEKSILESYGYGVDLAGDGSEAFDMAMKIKYDLVITDVEMPFLDGFSLTEKLRADEIYRDTPVIIVTSRDKDEDRKRGIKAGANAYIVKGDFQQSKLVETVQNLIG